MKFLGCWRWALAIGYLLLDLMQVPDCMDNVVMGISDDSVE